MGTFVWLYSPRTNSPHITMNSFVVFATLVAAACAAPQTVVNTVNQGPQTGPATPIIGDAVATPKGFRSLALEGFSEDLNQDGFVDPIVPAAPAPVVVPAPAPIARIAAPVAVAPQVAFPTPVAAPIVKAAPAPVAVAAAPQFANQPLFHAAAFPHVAAPVFNPAAVAPQVAAPVFNAPVTTVQHVAPAAPVVTRTISPIPVPFRHAPVAHVFDSRLHA